MDVPTNLVTRRFNFRVDLRLKGPNLAAVFVLVPGGRIQFRSSGLAEVSSIESRSIRLGMEFTLFLQGSGSELVPTNGIEGMFSVDPRTGAVQALAVNDTRPHAVSTVKLGTLSGFMYDVKQGFTSTAANK